MKAKELAELLLKHPESEVLISPSEKKINPYGMDMEQKIKSVDMACFWYVPVDCPNPIRITTVNFGNNNF